MYETTSLFFPDDMRDTLLLPTHLCVVLTNMRLCISILSQRPYSSYTSITSALSHFPAATLQIICMYLSHNRMNIVSVDFVSVSFFKSCIKL